MPPYQRRRYFYRNWWNGWKRRGYFRRRRFAKPFRGRKRRKRTVRKNYFYRHKKYNKKLKKIKIQQWQPSSIKNCRITGYLPLFQAGKQRISYNYAQFKESFVPQHEPGGGGWSIQQLSLCNLYSQNNELMNYWTKSNNRLNLCRYRGVKITLFRQPLTDYVFTYFYDCPRNVTKMFYASHHPFNLLTHNRKIVVPSFASQPHKRKPYKKKYIKPPKGLKNQWYFQQNFCQFPLLTFAVSSCSLSNMFGSNTASNTNCTLYCLDTTFIQTPCFQYKTPTHPTYGYRPNTTNFLWGIPQPVLTGKNTYKNSVYLGNAMINDEGTEINNNTTIQQYGYDKWGNPFFWAYLTGNMHTFISQATETPEEILKNTSKQIQESQIKKTPYVYTVRYNPWKDKGKGNELYFIPTYDTSQNNWEPTRDTDIHFSNFPLWLMAWGLESIIKRMGKCPHIDDDWICVIKSSYLTPPATHYVPLSYNFIHGLAPYTGLREDITPYDNGHWYPKWKFQKEAIENIIQTGPAVCRSDNIKFVQATMKYDFFFKWGGNPAPMESVYDPTTQPITPLPSGLETNNEIISPETPIQSFLYDWDQRRDFLTPKATERIQTSPTNDILVFTDGRETSTDLPLFKNKTQKKETSEAQEETLLQHLQQLQQYNLQLQQRFNRLTSSLKDL
nr:MAG: ORF1 [TTV-like mini virus]